VIGAKIINGENVERKSGAVGRTANVGIKGSRREQGERSNHQYYET
jgi:hypothetical protein